MANRHAAACAIRAGSIPGATIGRLPVIPQRLPRRKHGAGGTGDQSRIRAAPSQKHKKANLIERETERERERERETSKREKKKERERLLY